MAVRWARSKQSMQEQTLIQTFSKNSMTLYLHGLPGRTAVFYGIAWTVPGPTWTEVRTRFRFPKSRHLHSVRRTASTSEPGPVAALPRAQGLHRAKGGVVKLFERLGLRGPL